MRVEMEQAESILDQLTLQDPYSLDWMQLYSNVLFVKQRQSKLAMIAKQCNDIDQYRTETCCVIGMLNASERIG